MKNRENLLQELMENSKKLTEEQLTCINDTVKMVLEPKKEKEERKDSETSFATIWAEECRQLEGIPMYSRNATMEMLGKQSFSLEGSLLEDYLNVRNAHKDFIPYPDIYDLAFDMLSLGIIYGKREERKKKKGEKA